MGVTGRGVGVGYTLLPHIHSGIHDLPCLIVNKQFVYEYV
jgi:hypothetical protein